MVCNTCGRQVQNEAANFCEYCGASVREKSSYRNNPSAESEYSNPQTVNSTGINTLKSTEKEQTITFFEWIRFYAVLLVPIANIVMLVIWAFSYDTPVNKKNWARATLIFMVVLFLLLFLLLIQYIAYMMNSPVFWDIMKQYGGTVQ